MKLYGGIDLHSNNSVVALSDEEDRIVFRRRLANEASEVLAALEPYGDAIEGLVVESTYNWYWLVDALTAAGYRVHLANTAAIVQYSGLKYGDDDSDAAWLAKLLRLGLLPEGYIYPKAERAVRDLLRRRSRLVQQHTANILAVQNLLSRNRGKSRQAPTRSGGLHQRRSGACCPIPTWPWRYKAPCWSCVGRRRPSTCWSARQALRSVRARPIGTCSRSAGSARCSERPSCSRPDR